MATRALVRTGMVVLLLTDADLSRADDPGAEAESKAFGVELDLLPTVLSAVAGEVGVGGNVWVGKGNFRFRAVGTHMAFPSGFQTPSGFEDRRLTVAAGIVDYFFQRGFAGPWIGGGVEYWWNTVGSPMGPATASWSSA